MIEKPTAVSIGAVPIGGQTVRQIFSSVPLQFLEAQNKDASALWRGAVVCAHPSGYGVALASSESNNKPAIGLSCQGVQVNFTEIVQLAGLFRLNDWTAIVGSVNLAPMTCYWLDATAGKLISSAPGSGISQIVGYSLSPVTLRIDIQRPILL